MIKNLHFSVIGREIATLHPYLTRILQTFWTSLCCVCSPDIAAQELFRDDHEPRRTINTMTHSASDPPRSF